MDTTRKLISIISPCYNEADNVVACFEAVRSLFDGPLKEFDFEHIFADNCSTDATVEKLRGLAAGDRRVRVILNSRNFGPFRSNFNALLAARGDAIVVFLPADLQDPPEIIPQFVAAWEAGFEVVAGVRQEREESWLLRSIRKVYYRVVSRLANIEIPIDVGEFQLIDRQVLDSLKQFDDYYPYIRGMIASCGFRATSIPYRWRKRAKGVSKNRWYNLIDQGLNGMISFTNVPLRLCMFGGIGVAALSFLYGFLSLFVNVLYYRQLAAPGIPTLIVALFFFSGLQLFFFGILGEYIAAIHSQVRKRPVVIERERINFTPPPAPVPFNDPDPLFSRLSVPPTIAESGARQSPEYSV
jgi:glycosyltransferase involved in cell wall biosynthesis